MSDDEYINSMKDLRIYGERKRDLATAHDEIERSDVIPTVIYLRSKGASWREIGDALDIHKDTAAHRYQEIAEKAGKSTRRMSRCKLPEGDSYCRRGAVAAMVGGDGLRLVVCEGHAISLAENGYVREQA